MTGHLFGDRYQVGDTLGFGGMSEVHRGRDLRLGRDVAIKVLRADLARDPSFQTRFRREAQNAASLNHPAIVAVYDTGETPGETSTIPYIVMEYVDGDTLRDLLKREGSLAPKRAMEIIADVCAALDFSHRHGIVHRDIKPANVMLTRAGAVKVMDFGIARAVADGQATMTATAAVIGTAQYLSPEQARGEAVDARSDVYATGCVLFELLVGAPPFTGDSPVAVAYQHVREDPKAPSAVKPGLPPELDSIVLKALNKNPLNRYQTAAEMRSDLVRALSGQAVHATPIMSDEERTQVMRPQPQRVGAMVVAGPSLLAPPRRPMPDEVWDEDDEPNRSKKVWGYVGIGALCLALLAGAIFLTLKVTKSPAQVPQVAAPLAQGLTLTAARTAIIASGLTVGSVTPVESATVPSGIVTRQDPSQGTPWAKGRAVNLQVSKGVGAVTVPNLATLTPAQATAALTKLNLVFRSTTQNSTDAQKGLVFQQNPLAGTSVKPGSTVSVQVGLGPKFQRVPTDLKGKSYDQALAELKQLKLNASKTSIPGAPPVDTVLNLSGASAGAPVQEGTTIVLQVSDNSLFIVPNLANLSIDDAQSLLQGTGWTGGFTQFKAESTDLTLIGKIADGIQTVANPEGGGATLQKPGQDPAVGKTVPKTAGFTVVVYGKKSITIPNFTPGKTPTGEAVNALQALAPGSINLKVVTISFAPSAALAHTFISVDPNSGSVIEFDTPITLTVYGDPPPPPTTPPTPTPPTVPPTTPAAPTTPTVPPTTPTVPPTTPVVAPPAPPKTTAAIRSGG